jgi:hypothetical protein
MSTGLLVFSTGWDSNPRILDSQFFFKIPTQNLPLVTASFGRLDTCKTVVEVN